eukprot:1514431-Rhodomonas_salina.1
MTPVLRNTYPGTRYSVVRSGPDPRSLYPAGPGMGMGSCRQYCILYLNVCRFLATAHQVVRTRATGIPGRFFAGVQRHGGGAMSPVIRNNTGSRYSIEKGQYPGRRNAIPCSGIGLVQT